MNIFTVYLGSSGRARPIFKEQAIKLGQIIGDHGKELVYGGMDAGLMGMLAKSALKHGARVTGIIPRKIKDSERILIGISEEILVDELCERKKLMFLRADAVIALPGGFGTLDESLEVLYWGQLGLHNKPLVLVNIEGYWDDVIKYIKPLPDFDGNFLIIVNNVDEIIPALESWNAPPAVQTPAHLPHFEDEILRDTDQPMIIDIPSIENTYFAICAIGLKQLGKHRRGIGFLNQEGEFNNLIQWVNRAAEETFVTPKCLGLFTEANNEKTLNERLGALKYVEIDLHNDKWGNA